MPLWDEYQDALKSNFADIPNIGTPGAASITRLAMPCCANTSAVIKPTGPAPTIITAGPMLLCMSIPYFDSE